MFFDYPNPFKPSKNNLPMIEFPLPVAIAALIQNNHILLIKRIKGSFIGFWGLPGGKIEKKEHVSQAAVREIEEETGIKSEFKNHIGFISEHLVENNQVMQHFLLHLCELRASDFTLKPGKEGALEWFDLNTLQQNKERIIPSDYVMIEKMIKNKGKNYYNCVVHKQGEEHTLIEFE